MKNKESPRNHPKSSWKPKNPYERVHQKNKPKIAKASRRDEFFEKEARFEKWSFSGPLTPDFYGPLNPPRQWPISDRRFDMERALENIKDYIPKKRIQYNTKHAGCAIFNDAAFNDGKKFVEAIKQIEIHGTVPLGCGDNNDLLQKAYAGPPTESRLHLYTEDGDANTERTIDKSIHNIENHAHRPTLSGSDCQSFLAIMWPVSKYSDLRKVKKFECLDEKEYSFYMIAQYIFHAAVPTRHSKELSFTILKLVYLLAIRGVLGPFDNAEKRANMIEYDLFNDRSLHTSSDSSLEEKAGQAIGWLGKFMTNSGFSPGLRCFRWFYRYVTDSTTVLLNANKFLEWDQVITRHIQFRKEEWDEEQEILLKLQNTDEPVDSQFHDFYVPEDGDCLPIRRYSLPNSSEPSTSNASQQSGSNKPREITFNGIRVGQLVPIPRPQAPQKPYERHTYDELNVRMEEHNYLVMAGLTKIKRD
ncbi:Protein CBG27443 [Caenorhabditis briggsae]|uniref:Protein CBG27443 n=1 Tax=Caenorhabditis briggsae TaxID=6238 RepID=B6IK20_CAEBR|nr:Protein CBG27443 [Caenorhabditis briggsae]CAS00250.1 Protein CBG27443 [Caenorhabditis briggsae]